MSSIQLEVLQDNDCGEELEEFIRSSGNGTIFHSPRFLSYHQPGKFEARGGAISHLLFRKKSRIVAFLPGMIFPVEGGREFQSPYGSSYGSLVHAELSFEEAQQILDLALKHIRQSGVGRVRLVPSPAIYAREDNSDYFSYLLLQTGFAIWKVDLLTACRLLPDEEYPDSALRRNARKFKAQALQQGVTAGRSEDLGSFYEILVENRAGFGVQPTHSREELERLGRLFPGQMPLYMAYSGGQAVAGALLFLCNQRVTNCFYLCHRDAYADLRPNNLLVPVILKELSSLGFHWMDFGPSSFGYQPHESLIRYKESFGGQGACRCYYQLDC